MSPVLAQVNGFEGPAVQWLALAPLLATAGAAMVIVTLQALRHRVPRGEALALPVTLAGLLTAGGFLFPLWHRVVETERPGSSLGAGETLGGAVIVDGVSTFLQGVVIIATLLAVLVAAAYLKRDGLDLRPEHHVLVLLSATGMLAMCSANDLIVVFVALEVLSIPLYVLAGFRRGRPEGQEASLKYFVLGAFSSAIFLYGVALVYGTTGSTDLERIQVWVATGDVNESVTLVGVVLIIVGLGFKVSAVPFHFWTPDVYQGAPTPITGFMAAGAKVAGFAALVRVLIGGVLYLQDDWRPVIWILAVLTLVVSSAAAIVQRDVKRMLAYSSIGHAGFVFIGLYPAHPDGVSAILTYLSTYAITIVGTFAVITLLGGKDDEHHDIDGYRGLSRREPFLAAMLTLFLFAQAGIPLTSGFIAKLEVFTAAVGTDASTGDPNGAWSLSLAVVGALASVVAAFMYLRIVVTMYSGPDHGHDAEHAAEPAAGGGVAVLTRTRVDVLTGSVIVVAAVVTVYVGIVPASVIDLAETATESIRIVGP